MGCESQPEGRGFEFQHRLQDGHFTTKVMPSKLLNNQPSFERKSELSKIDNLGPIL